MASQHPLLCTSNDLRCQDGGDKGRRYHVEIARGDSMCARCKCIIDQGEVEVTTEAATDEEMFYRHLGCFSDKQVWNTGRLGNLNGYLTLQPAQQKMVLDRYRQVAELEGGKLPTPPRGAKRRWQAGNQRQSHQQAPQQRTGWRQQQQQVGRRRQGQWQHQPQPQRQQQGGQYGPPARNGQAHTQTPVARRLEPFLGRPSTEQFKAHQPPPPPQELHPQIALTQHQHQQAQVLVPEPLHQRQVKADVPPACQQQHQGPASAPRQQQQQQQEQQQQQHPTGKHQLQAPPQAPAKGAGVAAPRRKQLTLRFCSKPAAKASIAGHEFPSSPEQGWEAAAADAGPTAGTEFPQQQRKKPRLGDPTASGGSLPMAVPYPPSPGAAAAVSPTVAPLRYLPLPLNRVVHESVTGKASGEDAVCSHEQQQQRDHGQCWGSQGGEQLPSEPLQEAREMLPPTLPASREVQRPEQQQQQRHQQQQDVEVGVSPVAAFTPASQAVAAGELLHQDDPTPTIPQELAPAAAATAAAAKPLPADAAQPGKAESPPGMMGVAGQPVAIAMPLQQQPDQQQAIARPTGPAAATAAAGELLQQPQTSEPTSMPQQEEQQHEVAPPVLTQPGPGAKASKQGKPRRQRRKTAARISKLERKVAKLKGQILELERQGSGPLIGPGWALGLARAPSEQALRQSIKDAQAAERDLQAQKAALQERARELE